MLPYHLVRVLNLPRQRNMAAATSQQQIIECYFLAQRAKPLIPVCYVSHIGEKKQWPLLGESHHSPHSSYEVKSWIRQWYDIPEERQVLFTTEGRMLGHGVPGNCGYCFKLMVCWGCFACAST